MRTITPASRWAEPCTKACRMPGSVWLTLSYSDASDTGRLSICRAAACSDGRSPSDTSVINSTTVENSNSREYWRWRSASNTASIQSGESACSKAVRAITLAGACCSNRARRTGHTAPDFVDAAVISQSLFGWIGPKTLVQPHEWTAFLLRRVAVHIYHLTTANLLKSRTPIVTGVTPIIACLTSETQQNRLLEIKTRTY